MRKECLALSSVAIWVALSSATPLTAQAACNPPKDLRVCQDEYGARGRVFLVWTNGEATYTGVRIFVDDISAGEGPGNALVGYISDVLPGRHTFAVEGFCGEGPTTRVWKSFDVVASTPNAKPIESLQCSFDGAKGRLTASWALSARPMLFADVYIRRAGSNGLFYVTTLWGDAKGVAIDGVLESDRLRLQFFDENCYGSELLSCPGPSCLPPVGVKVCQDLYGDSSRVFVAWAPAAADYTGYKVLVDGKEAGVTGSNRHLFYVSPIAPGQHTFGVVGLCGSETTQPTERTFEVLTQSPHTEPARRMHCVRDPAARTLTATWLSGARPSEFIDVYLKKQGVALLDFVGTIAGDSTRVRVKDAGPPDEVRFQFFDTACYGSPLMACGDSPGSRQFLRGDVNGSAVVDLSDAVAALRFLFIGDFEPLCADATDANDDTRLDIADPIFVLSFLFAGGLAPPSPGPDICGLDPTPDSLGECLTAACE